MASHQSVLQHGIHVAHPQVNGQMTAPAQAKITPAHLASLNENVWLLIGMSKRPVLLLCSTSIRVNGERRLPALDSLH